MFVFAALLISMYFLVKGRLLCDLKEIKQTPLVYIAHIDYNGQLSPTSNKELYQHLIQQDMLISQTFSFAIQDSIETSKAIFKYENTLSENWKQI